MLTSSKLHYRIYDTEFNGRSFQIDGQNHEFDSKEWQVFEIINDEMHWIETYPTKRAALEDIPTWA